MKSSRKKIFVSYSHTDAAKKEKITHLLQEYSGCDVWSDARLHGGEAYFSTIAKQILASDYLVLLLSAASASSDFVKQELEFAKSERKLIFPIWLEEVELPANIRFIIQNTHYMFWFSRESDESFGQELVEAFQNEDGYDSQEEETSWNGEAFFTPSEKKKIQSLLAAEEEGKHRECCQPENAVLLGRAYQYGCQAEKDIDNARYYFKVAQYGGSLEGTFHLLRQKLEALRAPEKSADKTVREQYQLSVKNLLEEMEKMAEEGCIAADVFLGGVYYNGRFRQKANIARGVGYWKIAAQADNPEAQFNISYAFYAGEGMEKDYDMARMMALLSMEYGYPKAARILGNLYRKGYGVQKAPEKAMYYYEKGVQLGDLHCYNFMGDLYSSGYGVPQDYEKALECFQKAEQAPKRMKAARCSAKYGIGWAAEHGKGMKMDLEKALSCYLESWQLGKKYCGQCIERCISKLEDQERRLYWYQESWKKGVRETALDYGCLLEEGDQSSQIAPDRELALSVFEAGAEKGNAQCCIRLIPYYSGLFSQNKQFVNREKALANFSRLLSGYQPDENAAVPLWLCLCQYGAEWDVDLEQGRPEHIKAMEYFQKALEESMDAFPWMVSFAINYFDGRALDEKLDGDPEHCGELLELLSRYGSKVDNENPEQHKALEQLLEGLQRQSRYYGKRMDACREKADVFARLAAQIFRFCRQ